MSEVDPIQTVKLEEEETGFSSLIPQTSADVGEATPIHNVKLKEDASCAEVDEAVATAKDAKEIRSSSNCHSVFQKVAMLQATIDDRDAQIQLLRAELTQAHELTGDTNSSLETMRTRLKRAKSERRRQTAALTKKHEELQSFLQTCRQLIAFFDVQVSDDAPLELLRQKYLEVDQQKRTLGTKLADQERANKQREAAVEAMRKLCESAQSGGPGGKRKAEKVGQKVKPLAQPYPEYARTRRQFPEDPLRSLPPLPTHPPYFYPTAKLDRERMDSLDINHDGNLMDEVKLFEHVMRLNEDTLAFVETDRGTFRSDYFSDYIYPIIEHTPRAFKNIPIPPSILDKVIELLKFTVSHGVYEHSQSAYRSRWFCPLNKVTVRDAGVLPLLDEFVQPYAGCQIFTVFDLFSGFDARTVEVFMLTQVQF
ncbi:hypothetical protein B0H13DRAFT_2308111 [Mycena leptocephala]|nr:hypothetical protein B0H13DRAFT_2308111 [Mycena leptocephala]